MRFSEDTRGGRVGCRSGKRQGKGSREWGDKLVGGGGKDAGG